MQRSSSLKFGHMVRGQLLGLVGNWRDIRRSMASDPWGSSKGDRGSRGDPSSDRPGGAGSTSDRTEAQSSSNRVTSPRASATSMVTSDAAYYTRGINQGALERRVNREDNMWHTRGYIDTQWLNPRDPTAYKPNFRQTEPTILRKQFMRSPDEVSREVLGRDWEEAVKSYKRSALTNMPDPAVRTGWEQQQHNTLQLVHPSQHQQQQQQNQHSQKHSQQAKQQQQHSLSHSQQTQQQRQQHSQDNSQQIQQHQQYQWQHPQHQQYQQYQRQQPQHQHQEHQHQHRQHQQQQPQYQQPQYQKPQYQQPQYQHKQQQQHQQQHQQQQQQHQQKYKHWNVNPLEDQE